MNIIITDSRITVHLDTTNYRIDKKTIDGIGVLQIWEMKEDDKYPKKFGSILLKVPESWDDNWYYHELETRDGFYLCRTDRKEILP